MIPKSLAEITEEVLNDLIRNHVREGRTIEYKREMPGNTYESKKEFLADVSSFPNSAGGDLIFGIDEDRGIPTKITALQSGDFDLEIRRLESLLASGLAPRIRSAIRAVECGCGKVLIIRVERSWVGPHRVVLQGHDKFYGRNSAGKYPLDVEELRTAFTLPTTLTERIRAFRADRVIAISNSGTPVALAPAPKIVLHCIPIESFAGQPQYDLLPLYREPISLMQSDVRGWSQRLNLEGLLGLDASAPTRLYTQVYRNGAIELVDAGHLAYHHSGRLLLNHRNYESYTVSYLTKCLEVTQKLGVSPPVVVALTLTRTRGLEIVADRYGFERGFAVQKDTLILPEAMLQDFSMPAARILKPMFDLVWNACGYEGSWNFDAEGNWVAR